MRTYIKSFVVCCIATSLSMNAAAQDEEYVDATDPTKIQTFVGLGAKYTDYTNGETMLEARTIGNIGLTEQDMLLFEIGYGWHDGDLVAGHDSGITNGRIRWFHLGEMKYDLERGFRGFGFQVDAQLAGRLKGTDGQNLIMAGIMPVFALRGNWNLYLTTGAVGTWDKGWAVFNGAGVSVTPQFVFSPDNWWQGAQIQITPSYNYFLTGTLENDGGGNIDVNIGGNISTRTTWDVTYQKNVDVDLNSFRRDTTSGLENDWNVFVNVTGYF
jgi:hypothetical protein